MPDRFEMDGYVIERNVDADSEFKFNLIEPAPIAALGVGYDFLFSRMAGRRRCTTAGSLTLRNALLAFVSEDVRVTCFFCSDPAIGLHRYFVPYCEEHSDQPMMCSECSCWIPPDNFNGDRDMCMECWDNRCVTCDGCGEVTDQYEEMNGEYYCQSCTDNMVRCENCGRRIDDEDRYCSRCQRHNIPIHESHARVVDVLNKSRFGEVAKDGVYFGVELEVEVSGAEEGSADFSDVCCGILDAMGRDFIILKYDGSLGPGGVEINTLPCTLKVMKEQWCKFFKNKPVGLTSWKNNRCGIHIHITRQPLGMLTIGKMTVFLNDPKNMDFIKQIAGRYDNGYCKVKAKKVTDTGSDDRYEMLNLTSTRTVEMRIFKGTLNKVHFLADVEFAHALVQFCRVTSIRHLDQAKFIQFIRQNRKEYPNLYTFSCKEEKGVDE